MQFFLYNKKQLNAIFLYLIIAECNFLFKDININILMNNNYLDVFFNLNNNTKAISPVGVESILSIIGLGATNDLLSKLIKLYHNHICMIQNLAKFNDFKKSMIYENYLFTNNIPSGRFYNLVNKYININKLDGNDINSIVENDTNIKNCFDTSNIVTNDAIFFNVFKFKMPWLDEFDAELTEDIEFHSTNGTINIPAMYQRHFMDYCYGSLDDSDNSDNNYIAIKLPFSDGSYCEFIMGLPSNFNLDKLKNIYYSPKMINLYLPKFTHEETIDLLPVLKNSNLPELFQMNMNNMGNIYNDNSDLIINTFQQKIIWSFDETGIENPKNKTYRCKITREYDLTFDEPFHYRIIKDDITLLTGYFNG